MLAVIDDGKVVECGTYQELMRKKGEYFKLYQIQAEALKYVGIGQD
jgi:ATP-binding cassette subfamily B protein